jgi:hypothetical protein
MSSDLAEIINLKPVTIQLSGINHEGKSITVDGIAGTKDDVFNYARDLRNSFGNAIISSVKAITEGAWAGGFDFELYIDKG